MTRVAREQNVEQVVRLGALFTAFLIIALCGVDGGSGIVWARRIAVENRRWIGDGEFADILSLCQFMPGPNIIGIAVCVGAKMRGVIGAIAALCGFLVIPWTVGLSLGVLYLNPHSPDEAAILSAFVAVLR
jgi:chromate transporter